MESVGKRKEIYVFADWIENHGEIFMGVLRSEILRGKEIFSFEYDQKWLNFDQSQILDPDLHQFTGKHYLNNTTKSNFGMFLDSSPDRWGRLLMQRREAAIARRESRPIKNLFESDYLLGVFDANRQGGLRFKLDFTGNFLNDNKEMASPPWTSIRELEQISLLLENEDIVDNPDYIKWLNILMAPGSSLGGARPKASVLDLEGNLWIAKIPSKTDQFDIGGWEMVTNELAKAAGLNVSQARAQKFSTSNHTYLSKRFDRNTKGKRIHFASAMTLLGRIDGQDHAEGVSYLELVDFISSNGAKIENDLEELWRRIVFNICVSNTDDHLRNHGFILTRSGWILSPAYDINPIENGNGLKLNISENDNSLDISLAMDVHPYFRLKEPRALEIINEVKTIVKNWESVAKKYSISKIEQEIKSKAFQLAK